MDDSLRQLVRKRAEEICEYCRVPQLYDPLPFQIDHIVARQHHGPTASENLALACLACNNHKGPNIASIDLESGSENRTPLFHPRQDTWNDHFFWDGPLLKGRTATGRVTIHVLGINLSHRVALRETLIEESIFPT